MTQLAGDSQTAAVGFYDGFADRESHAGAVDLHALISATIKLFENQGLLEIVDARTAMGDAGGAYFIVRFGVDADGSAGGRILGRVVAQVHKVFFNVRGIHASIGK